MSYAKLRGAIREKFGDQASFARAMDLHPGTLSNKLNGRTEWARPEIERACTLLGVPIERAHEYFFTP